MTRYFLNKTEDGDIENIVLQDNTGVYYSWNRGGIFGDAHLDQTPREYPIYIGKNREIKKRVMTTSKEFLEYHRVYERNRFNTTVPTEIIEDPRTKEEIVASFNK